MTDLRIEVRAFDHVDVVDMIAAIQKLYMQLYGGHDQDRTDPAQFEPPDGLFLVGYLDGRSVAVGGWRRVAPDVAEVKRMYVIDSTRGHGFARRMLAELETTARVAGATRMVLNTGYRQHEAIALYESSGYARSEDRFGHYADIEGAFFYSKEL